MNFIKQFHGINHDVDVESPPKTKTISYFFHFSGYQAVVARKYSSHNNSYIIVLVLIMVQARVQTYVVF